MAHYCANTGCLGISEGKRQGLCPKCWLKLSDEERATLEGKRESWPSGKSVTVMYPPQSRWATLAVGLIGGIAGAAGFLVLRLWLNW